MAELHETHHGKGILLLGLAPPCSPLTWAGHWTCLDLVLPAVSAEMPANAMLHLTLTM